MAINLSALSNFTTAATALSNLILVSPQKTVGYQPQNAPSWKRDTSTQPPALLFNYEGEQAAKISSDITDHFIEDNTAIQDQIALKPVFITTQGFIAELNDIAPAALAPVQQIAEKLTTITGYQPALSETALLAYAQAFQLYQVGLGAINSAVSTWSTINGSGGETVINGSTAGSGNGILTGQQPNQTQQQIYYQQFYAYWQNRTLFTLQTPWAIFQDMTILDMNAVQDETTRMISTFNLTFKQMRFASTALVDQSQYSDNSNFQGRLFNQGAPPTDLGTSQLQPSNLSFASTLA